MLAEPRRVQIWRDVHPEQPHLPAVHPRVRVLELAVPLAQTLDLGALQLQSRLDRFEDVVLMPGAAIPSDEGTVIGNTSLSRAAGRTLGHGATTVPATFPN